MLIGGRTLSASNNDGTANTLLGEPKTGSDGSTADCKTPASTCFRFVKQAAGAGTRYPSALPQDGSGSTISVSVKESSMPRTSRPKPASSAHPARTNSRFRST